MNNVVTSVEGNVVNIAVKPKQVQQSYNGQKLVVTYKPDADEKERWGYHVQITRTYDFYGSAPTEARALKKAREVIELHCGVPQKKKAV